MIFICRTRWFYAGVFSSSMAARLFSPLSRIASLIAPLSFLPPKPGHTHTQLMIFMFGTPWSYAGVFSSSMAALLFSYLSDHPCDVYHHPDHSCRMTYYGLLAFFGVYGISLAMMNVSEQAAVQRFMTLYRGVGM